MQGMIEQVAIGALSAVAGGAAAWAALQARVRRLEEITADLKSDKASKEALAVVASSVEKMQQEMDRRFDRIEALLIGGEHGRR
jgi:HAMP domain-containing protein